MKTSHKKQKSASPFRIAAIVILVTVSLFAFYKKFSPGKKAITTSQEFSAETQGRPAFPLIESTHPEAETAEKEVILATPPPVKAPLEKTNSCQELGIELNTFFSQLSSQDYIKAYEIEGSLQEYLNKIIIKLLNNPPIITNESDDMYTILKNGAHFYRILGPKDISLLKDIMAYESEGMENLFAALYSWSTQMPPCQYETLNFKLPLPKAYEYSVFFFNTLSGQSYLFRRESRLRTLFEYYSLRILDQAKKMGANRYNIDIATTISSVKRDIEQTDYLLYKNRYIQTLNTLQNKPQLTHFQKGKK